MPRVCCRNLFAAAIGAAGVSCVLSPAVAGPVTSEPDTFMVLFDRLGAIINADDNDSDVGNGLASGLFGVTTADGIVDNLDGSFSLRVGVTGWPDGFDGNFNGYFQSSPHGQSGRFSLSVWYYDEMGAIAEPTLPFGGGVVPNPTVYENEFTTGAEAFHVNFTMPIGTASVDLVINNLLSEPCEPADINNDGVVDTADLGILIGAFGTDCP